ncbi:uncharacterized protein LOC113494324 [Trichoplusia ni]|uniref:Uncharacterized protein LOC113494324 n=1 Tax=Trichoplusia ni TaxID=7111 RepID=A0A7E5VJE8_TRINI|nr:uncharacterized protein LOC113494324 [Trichoplusia ni]
MKVINLLAFILQLSQSIGNTDGVTDLVESWPVSECFCQHSNNFLDMTIVVNHAKTNLVNNYRVYELVTKKHDTNSRDLFSGPTDRDKNITYETKLKHIKRLLLKLELKNPQSGYPSSATDITIFEKGTQSDCPGDKDTENRCIINLDLSSAIDRVNTKMSVTTGKQGQSHNFYCQSAGKQHNWCLRYKTGQNQHACLNNITILPVNFVTELILQFERFDNGMMVQCSNDESNTLALNTTLSVTSTIERMPLIKYNSLEDTRFDCMEYENTAGLIKEVYVVFVSLSNVIEESPSPVTKRFDESDNGGMLCCVYYTRSGNIVTRHVANKTTLVLYDDGTDTSVTHAESYNGTNYNILYIAGGIASVVILAIGLIAKRFKFKKTNSQHLELETYATTERVLYADLDNLRESPSTKYVSNATPYATIIGSLHPAEDGKK